MLIMTINKEFEMMCVEESCSDQNDVELHPLDIGIGGDPYHQSILEDSFC